LTISTITFSELSQGEEEYFSYIASEFENWLS